MVVTVAPSKSQVNCTSKLEAMCMPEMIVSANTYPAVICNALQKQPHDMMYTLKSAFLCNATQRTRSFWHTTMYAQGKWSIRTNTA